MACAARASVQTRTVQTSDGQRRRLIHPAWIVAAVAFLALVGAAGFRAAPSALMVPLEEEFGWTRTELSLAVTVNLVLFGLTAPFAAALMARFGMRRVTTVALLLVAGGAALSVLATTPAMLVATWGVMIGLGTGSMALVFAATVADQWFVRSRGLVVGVLTAGSATGQLVFLPFIALLVEGAGWRQASLLVAAGALVVVPLVLLFLRNRPADLGTTPYGAPEGWTPPVRSSGNAVRTALSTLRRASRSRTFWALAAGFAICGATTNGLVGTHFIPSAHDHGMATTTAAGLLALVGIFDIVGTIASGWLTDRVNPRILLGVYYAGRGIGLAILPLLLSDSVSPPLILFVVIYGLDWVATVPPTVALCRELFGADGPVVFGWVFAAHQIGAAIAATVAGTIRDVSGEYTLAWFGAAGLCAIAAILSIAISRRAQPLAAAA
ncbi:MFS transporter [Agrococcus jejuensis]|uniref:Predicted arabinose efflux permease, MFS family n=1 Tax=Agrococcus jejuensis TaxID=399736 RepID=A0A1G7ZT16_9MICO|nr:MFS transporter [Agrococcus jejuensis]SDH11828.1 Predicted arabinose efflux permease, MFS family [Agrococcus jejuensis]